MKRDNKTGKFVKSAIMVDRTCQNCDSSFQIKKSRLKYGGGKYCSRKCVDEHKQKTYKGSNNPMYGKNHNEDTLKKKSEIAKKLWNDDEFVEKVRAGREEFLERASKDGTWDRAKIKREETLLKKYGVKHIWEGTYGDREVDKTFYDKYGMPSYEYMNAHNNLHKNTSIERIVHSILQVIDVQFIKHYRLDGREFDVYLPNLNILIECDGDYWHGKDVSYDELNETQLRSRQNDKIKNDIAKKHDIKLIRFWGSDIRNKKFKSTLINKIYG